MNAQSFSPPSSFPACTSPPGRYCNSRFKLYPSMTKLQIANRAIFAVNTASNSTYGNAGDNFAEQDDAPVYLSAAGNADTESGNESINRIPEITDSGQKPKPVAVSSPTFQTVAKIPSRAREEAKRRAKASVSDIALCNQFEYMFTWTLDPAKVNRYDPGEVYRYVRTALSNMSRRKGFEYLAVPEYHSLKPGESRPAIHIHGLCNPGSVRLEPAMVHGHQRTDEAGRAVYNMSDWIYGWSTAVKIDANYTRAANYISKYISKQPDKIFGKYYLSSRKLKKRPDILPVEDYVEYYSYRDEDKLAARIQHETNIYGNVNIITEIVEGDGL